jgi:hypothetical protein
MAQRITNQSLRERFGLPESKAAIPPCFRGTGRQLDADARGVLDHARTDLDQALPDGPDSAFKFRDHRFVIERFSHL